MTNPEHLGFFYCTEDKFSCFTKGRLYRIISIKSEREYVTIDDDEHKHIITRSFVRKNGELIMPNELTNLLFT